MQVKKRNIKLGKINKNHFLKEMYYTYIDKKIELSIMALEQGKVYTLEQVRKEVETW